MQSTAGRVSGGDDAHPARAKVFIPCLISECKVPYARGYERPSRMQLILRRNDGALLQRPFNDGPYYKCERVGCYYHEHPRGLHEINSDWIRTAGHFEPKAETKEDLEKKYEVMI